MSKKKPRNLISKMIQYCLVILPFLAVMLFALEPFYTSRSVIINILLGGFFCLLIQLYIFSKMFWPQLQQNNFNIIKTIIEEFNKFWGDRKPEFVEYRNQKKYFIPTESPDNNLFKPKGHFVYTKVMTDLRGKLTVDYMPKIKQIQTKCQYVEQRIMVIEKIYQFIVKDYATTAKGLINIIENAKKQSLHKQSFFNEHKLMETSLLGQLIGRIEQNIGLPASENKTLNCISWSQTFNIITMIATLFRKSEKEINEMGYKLIADVAIDVKAAKNSIVERLRKLYSSQKKGESDCIELVNRIRELENKIFEMSSRLDKVKKKQEYENQLNLQLEIKMNKSEASSLNVKLWSLKDISTLQSEQLYNECQKSHNSIMNLENTLEGNAQNVFKTFLETERKAVYEKIKYIKKIIEENQIPEDDSFYHSANESDIEFHAPTFDVDRFYAKYRSLSEAKAKQILFYKSFTEDICQVYEKRLEALQNNYQIIQRELMRIGGILKFQRLIMKHFFDEIERTKALVMVIRETHKSIRIKALKFQRNIEERKKKQFQISNDLKKKPLTSLSSMEKKEFAHQFKKTLSSIENTKIQQNYSQLQFIFPFTSLFIKTLESIEEQINIMEQTQKNQFEQSEHQKKFREYYSLLTKIGETEVTTENKPQDLNFLNKLIGVFLHDWKISEAFHAEIIEKLWLPLNRKRPDVLDELVIKYLKIEDIYQQQITKIRIPKSQIFHCIMDIDIMVRGRIGLTIQSKIKVNRGIPLLVKARINKAHLSLRLVYTPWAVGKSYVSFLSPPQLDITGDILLSNWNLSKFPLVGLLVKVFLIRIFKKILVWPMRVSMYIPASIRDTRALAVKERLKWLHEQEKTTLKWQQHVGNPI